MRWSGWPDWVKLIFTTANTSLQAIGLDRRFGQTALPSSEEQMKPEHLKVCYKHQTK